MTQSFALVKTARKSLESTVVELDICMRRRLRSTNNGALHGGRTADETMSALLSLPNRLRRRRVHDLRLRTMQLQIFQLEITKTHILHRARLTHLIDNADDLRLLRRAVRADLLSVDGTHDVDDGARMRR